MAYNDAAIPYNGLQIDFLFFNTTLANVTIPIRILVPLQVNGTERNTQEVPLTWKFFNERILNFYNSYKPCHELETLSL